MSRGAVVCLLLAASMPALAQWLPEAGANPPFVSTPGDVTSGGVVSGAEGSFLSLSNPDGGEVYLPAGLAVNPGSLICLNDTCSIFLYRTPAGLLGVISPAGTSFSNGVFVQTTERVGTLQPNAMELAGGAVGVTIRAVGGTGATPDAGLNLEPGAPRGRVNVGGYAMTLPVQPLPFECDSTTGPWFSSTIADVRPDAGFEYVPVWCDSQNVRAVTDAVPFNASSEAAGSGLAAGVHWLSTNIGPFSGELWWCTYDVHTAGSGGGTYTVQVKQGATMLCESPAISCTATGVVWDGDPRTPGGGDPWDGPCLANKIQARPPGGTAVDYLVHVEFSTGCSTNARGRLSCWARRQALQ